VIVIPSSPCMSVATREAIDMAGTRGQGLIVTGLAGVNDAGCRPLGYGLIVALTGASRAEPLEKRQAVYVTIPSGGPLSADIPPGARLDLSPASQVALRLRERDALYSNYTLAPAEVAGQPLLDGAISHSTYRGARVAYWGFELRDAVPRPWTRAVMSLLVRNSVSWAARLGIASVEPWPHDHQAAASFTQDVEHEFTNARHAADSLRAIGIPGTFFLISDLAVKNKRLARRLFEAGEVGSHSENHRRLGGTPFETQLARLQTTQRDLTELFGEPVSGLRPPEEQFDLATMRGWLGAGGTYVMGANDSRCVAPELLAIAGDTIVMLPRTGDDDFEAMGPSRPQDPSSVASALYADFSWIRALGGVYALSYHSQLLSRPEHLPGLSRVARLVAADTTVWVATAAEIASWWRARSELRTSARMGNGSTLEITVQNGGTVGVRGAVIRVFTPSGMSAVRANGQLLRSDAGTIRVLIPFIARGERKVVSVVLSGSA
ncbi:MAG: polysaccharide deacetylase family protein, partial [Gemmatimonadota bacterium]|nr:polysaccharide deacetylase family protein [Gemmatimonadota bacterium]